MQKGFTLIELLVVIAIIAILSVVVILTLNPAELLRQTRDSTRISDLSSLNSALSLYIVDVTTSYSLGGGLNCYQEVDDVIGIEWANGCDPDAGGAMIARFTAGTTQPSAIATRYSIDATGWVPVNFTLISTGGAPISKLPRDPSSLSAANRQTANLFYAYRTGVPVGSTATCDNTLNDLDCTVYEINADMESVKYANGGSGDVESTDGGNAVSLFEVGTRLNL